MTLTMNEYDKVVRKFVDFDFFSYHFNDKFFGCWCFHWFCVVCTHYNGFLRQKHSLCTSLSSVTYLRDSLLFWGYYHTRQ